MGRYWCIPTALASLYHQGLFCGLGQLPVRMSDLSLLSQTQKSFVLTYTKQIILENERTQLNPKLGYLKMAPLVEFLHPDPNS